MGGFEELYPEAVITGSFKFKPEIDAAINEFRDLNVIIRAPEIGWLFVPSRGLVVATKAEQFQPLPSEQYMMAGEVEAEFLAQLDQADFVYVINPERYLGAMSIFEIGYSRGVRKPIYASNELDFHALGIHDPKIIELMRASVPIMSPSEAARDIREKLALIDSSPSDGIYPTDHSSTVLTGRLNTEVANVINIAEGAIMRLGNRVMLVADGRWEDEKLTIPGTRVRPGEQKAKALRRLLESKIGADAVEIAHFATSFMIPESGYDGPIDPDKFVFNDHVVDLRSEHVQPRPGVQPVWVSNSELENLINSNQVEPNAAKLLANYLRSAA